MPLIKTTIKQDALAVDFQQVLGTCCRTGRAAELEFHTLTKQYYCKVCKQAAYFLSVYQDRRSKAQRLNGQNDLSARLTAPPVLASRSASRICA